MSGVSPVPVEWFHGLAWGCWCGRDHGLGCPVGMSGSGMGMLLGSRTATPRCSIVARFDAHAWWPVLGGWSDRVARGGLRTG